MDHTFIIRFAEKQQHSSHAYYCFFCACFQIEIDATLSFMFIALSSFARWHLYEMDRGSCFVLTYKVFNLIFFRRYDYRRDRVSNNPYDDPWDEFYFVCTTKYVSGMSFKNRAIYTNLHYMCVYVCVCVCVCVHVCIPVYAWKEQRRLKGRRGSGRAPTENL